MLCLSRKEDQSIICFLSNGDEIEISVSRIEGNQVRFAIEAPSDIKILREEILNED